MQRQLKVLVGYLKTILYIVQNIPRTVWDRDSEERSRELHKVEERDQEEAEVKKIKSKLTELKERKLSRPINFVT